MTKLKNEEIRKIRTNPWHKNKGGLSLDQEIIEESVKNLRLTYCPICKGKLERNDNFGTNLISNDKIIQRYCPNENYIFEMGVHQYNGNTFGTSIRMRIYTNSMHTQLIADSGELADINKYVNLWI